MEKLSPELRERLAGHYRVESIRTEQLAAGVRALAAHFGSVDRLLGMLEQIQVPLGEIRDQMQIPGMGAAASTNFRD